MPWTCFDYPADVPPGARKRDVTQASPRDPQSIGYPCFSYPAICFSYPSDRSLDVSNRDDAQPPLPGLRRMPHTCFRY